MGHLSSDLLNWEAPVNASSGHDETRPSIDSLLQRQGLYEKLTRVQRSISHGAPLQEVLDAITTGASQLLGDEVAAIRLIDEDDPTHCVIVSYEGVKEDLADKVRRTPVGQGAGGRSIRENKLVVIDDYSRSKDSLAILARDGLQAAMAAPVHEKGEITGSIVVASYEPGRKYSDIEQEALEAFAQHASLALTDAKAMEALREAQRSKEMFLAMVSHELKSPLTVILGTLYTLQKHHASVDEATREEMLASAYDRAKELAALVNRVLEGARAELVEAEEDVALPELVRTALKGFEQAASLVIGDVPEVAIRTDAAAIHQILGILMENAIAHSQDGKEITIETRVDDPNVIISVTNPGDLSIEDQDALFDPFSRGSQAKSDGVGLGLYIASRLANAVGGKLEADSSGGFVCFDLIFPFKRADQQTLQPADLS
jgi:K+-sensing histidine kinase KdpD